MSYNQVNTVTLVIIYSQTAVKMIDALERKILRQTSDPIQADSAQKITCEEIYKLYDDMALLTFLHPKKLQWTRHTVKDG
jgi:hypothetical protein